MVGTTDLKTDVFFWDRWVGTPFTGPVVWPPPYACAQHTPAGISDTMERCFALVTPHLHAIADTCRGGFFQKYTEKSRFEDLRGWKTGKDNLLQQFCYKIFIASRLVMRSTTYFAANGNRDFLNIFNLGQPWELGWNIAHREGKSFWKLDDHT